MVSRMLLGVVLAGLLLITLGAVPIQLQGPITASQEKGLSWQGDASSVPELTYQVNLDQVTIDATFLSQLLPPSCCVPGDRLKLVLTDQSTGQAVSYTVVAFAIAEVPGSAYCTSRNDTHQHQLDLRAVVNSGDHDQQASPGFYYGSHRVSAAAYGSKGGVWAYRAELGQYAFAI